MHESEIIIKIAIKAGFFSKGSLEFLRVNSALVNAPMYRFSMATKAPTFMCVQKAGMPALKSFNINSFDSLAAELKILGPISCEKCASFF